MPASDTSALTTVREFYRLVDGDGLEEAFAMLAEDASVRFGDQPDLVGREVIAEQIRGMRTLAQSWSHEFVHTYEVEGPGEERTVIIEGIVTYVMRHSGNTIGHRAVMIDVVDAHGQITAQRNVGDLTPVFADHAAHAPADAHAAG